MERTTSAAFFQEAAPDYGEDHAPLTRGDYVTRPEPEAPKPIKAKAPRQDKDTRETLILQADAGIAAITSAKLNASATALNKIDHACRVHAADTAGKDRKRVTDKCLGQRNALVRVLCKLEGVSELRDMTDRVRTGLDIIMALSANVSALSKSGWPETESWLNHQMVLLVDENREWMRGRFEWHLARARRHLSKIVATRWTDYRTAPFPIDIAHDLMITTAVLREAGANKVGLTSIDPESKRDRDRRNAAARRRNQGRKSQDQRNETAENKALGATVGKSGGTIKNWKDKGILEAKLAECRAKLNR